MALQNTSHAATKRTLVAFMAISLSAAAASAQSTVSCAAQGNGRQFCPAQTQNGVLLQDDHSHGSCHYGSTWGFNAQGIFVSGGCRGDFLVNGSADHHRQDDGDQRDHNDQAQGDRGNTGTPDGRYNSNNGNNPNGSYGAGDQRSHDRRGTLPSGTQIQVRLDRDVRPQDARQGESLTATLAQDLTVEGRQIAPAGTQVQLRITQNDPNRQVPLTVQLESMRTPTDRYTFNSTPIHSDQESQNRRGSDNNGNPLASVLGALENGGRQDQLSRGAVFTFSLLSPARPDDAGSDGHR